MRRSSSLDKLIAFGILLLLSRIGNKLSACEINITPEIPAVVFQIENVNLN